jgi:formylglycine-generating enzyme required for sulfatase activity
VTANYWDYATGSNTAPTPVAGGTASGTAVYNGQSGPADVHLAGGLSPYGTMGQNGNVWEWSESAFDGINNSSSESRAIRGGFWFSTGFDLRSSFRGSNDPSDEYSGIGFRVASVPEPSVALLVLMAGGAWLLRRRSKHSL